MSLLRMKLAVKLPALVILTVCLTALASGLLAIYLGRSIMRERVVAANMNSVESYSAAVAVYLRNARSVLEIAARQRDSDLFAGPEFRAVSQRPARARDVPERPIAADILAYSNVFEFIMLLRPNGSVYLIEPAALEPKLSRADLAFTPWYQKLMKTGQTVVSDLRISVATQRPTIIVATPVRTADGKVAAIWAGGLQLQELAKIGRGGESYGYITDSRGLIVTHQTKAKHSLEQTDFSSVPAVRAALDGRRGSGQWPNAVEGVQQLGAYMPLADLGWAVVHATSLETAYAPIDKLTHGILLASAALFLLMGSAGWIIARRITRPMQNLSLAAEEVAAGDFTRRIQVHSDDEVGQLADKFNRMAETLHERENDVRRHNEQLEQANRLKSEFLANMSHELRTPLNGIIGFAEIMHDGRTGPISDRHKEYLGDILSSGRHLLQLINDILDLAKIEAGKMEFSPAPVDPELLVREVCDIVRTLAASKRIHIRTEIDPTLTGVVADSRSLKQILYNYLSNALKFTGDEGSVTVRLKAEGADRFRIEVEDTGVGIDAENLRRLFVEFQQLDAGTAKRYPGTGLGLALTKRIVEAQSGNVGVTSTPGEGSIFYAVLPRVAPLRAGRAEQEDFTAPNGAPLILIVEDDAKDRAWLGRELSAGGYAVQTAATGTEALKRCRERRFDAITLDMMLPDISGREVLGKIRERSLNRDTPVVIVSVLADKGLGIGYEVKDILAKPASSGAILKALKSSGVEPNNRHPILVVDDDKSALKLADKTLRALGYRAVCKQDAASALEAAARRHPAAVVLDLVMPELNGFEFLKRFRMTENGRRTPVIVWTGKDLTKAERRQLQSTADSIVMKSPASDELLRELKGCFERRSLAAQQPTRSP